VPDRWKAIDYLDRLARLPGAAGLQHRIVMGETVPHGMIALDALPATSAALRG
jgi:hypothetical protein